MKVQWFFVEPLVAELIVELGVLVVRAEEWLVLDWSAERLNKRQEMSTGPLLRVYLI